MTYYNEHDAFAAAWLRELIKAGVIADGEVDERSIVDVTADDVRGFTQCHFFAGIGGWSYALRLAGWPDVRAVWTGSCPCQPFSSAGAQVGGDDPRHLWPAWVRLVRECRPAVLFGEQVAAAIQHGWLDLVFGDLEGSGYACGAAVLGAHSVGAPHIRQRVWFVADATGRHERRQRGESRIATSASRRETRATNGDTAGSAGAMVDAGELAESRRERREGERLRLQPGEPRHAGVEVGRGGEADLMGHANAGGRQRVGRRGQTRVTKPSATPWDDLVWLPCRDGKARPTEPGLQPLVDGVSGRVGRLRGYGNAINPVVAQAFIEAYLEGR